MVFPRIVILGGVQATEGFPCPEILRYAQNDKEREAEMIKGHPLLVLSIKEGNLEMKAGLLT